MSTSRQSIGRFEFATATRIIFGPGVVEEIGPLASQRGSKVLLVTGSRPSRSQGVQERLRDEGLEVVVYSVSGEPTTEVARIATEQARKLGCDLIVGFGGGSALDVGQAVSALLANGGDPLDYLEVIGKGLPLTKRAAPCIAVPTTAGTGTEVTRNAVLRSPEHGVKVSLRSHLMLPAVALVDPLLTHSVPPDVTASTGLDAFTQVLEPFVSRKANPLTDGLCREGIVRAARSMRRVYSDGSDAPAREDMALVSLFGGMALANAGLGAAHGFAGPLGGMFSAPHGAICAALLPHVMTVNVQALQERQPDNPALDRFDELARLVTGNQDSVAGDGVAWVQALCRDLQVPSLAFYGIGIADIPLVVEKAARSSSMKGNPLTLTHPELEHILRLAL